MTPAITILNSVQSVIDGLSIDNLSTVVRKRLFIKDPDELPIAIIAPGQPSIDSEHTENVIVWKRPVFVGIATPTGDGLLESDFSLADTEEQIRKALHVPGLSGASTVFDVDIDPSPLFIEAAADSGYDLTILTITFLSEESRS